MLTVKPPVPSQPMMVTSFLKDVSFGSNVMNSSSYANDPEFAVEEPVKISTSPEK